jgi:NADPH-dependent curcumin reductase CurA
MVTAVSAKKFVFAKRFHGLPQHDNFSLEVEELPELKTGGLQIIICYFHVIHSHNLIV